MACYTMKRIGDSWSRRTYLRSTSAVAATGITALAGCNSGGETDQPTMTVVGTVPRSGSFSSLGQDMERGYKLGVKRMSEQLEYEVDLHLADDESDPEAVQSNLERLSDEHDPDMIWGSFATPLVTAGSAFAEDRNVPFLGVAFAHEEPHHSESYEWTYAPFPKSRDMARSTVNVLEMMRDEDRPERVGIWEPETPWGAEQAGHWEEKLTAEGYEIAHRERYALGTDDFRPLIQRSRDAGVEVLLSNPTPPGGIAVINQMAELEWSPDVLKFIRAADPDAWWSALGRQGSYALTCPGWVPGLTDNGNPYLWETFDDEYGLEPGELIPVMVGGAFNLTQVALQSIRAAETTDPSAVQSALRSTTFQTVVGEFGFEDNGLPSAGDLVTPVGQWWDGEQRLAYPRSTGTASIDFKYPLPSWDQLR